MTSARPKNIPLAVKIALFGLVAGFRLTGLANLFIFSDTRIQAVVGPLLGRGFKQVSYEIGTMSLPLPETVLLIAGGIIVLVSYSVCIYCAEERKIRLDIFGFLCGSALSLAALPILHIWEPQPDKSIPPPDGPIAIHLILAVGAAIVIIVHVFKTGLFLQNFGIPRRTKVVIYYIVSIAVILDSSFFVIGVASFLHCGSFKIARATSIVSPGMCLVAMILGAISFARDKGEILDMETNREVRKTIMQRKQEEFGCHNHAPVLPV